MADNKDQLLYTIRSWYENKNKTGVMLILSAKDSRGQFHTLKAYVPYRSNFEDSPRGEILRQINNQNRCARVTVYTEKNFDNEN